MIQYASIYTYPQVNMVKLIWKFVPKEVRRVFLSSRKNPLMDSIKCTLLPVYSVKVYGLFMGARIILCTGSSASEPSSFVLSVFIPKYGLAMVKIKTLHSV